MNLTTLIELAGMFSEGRRALKYDLEKNVVFQTEQARDVAISMCASADAVTALVVSMEDSDLGIHDFKETVEWVREFSRELSAFQKPASFTISGGQKH
jgi:hypothetical protein